MDHLALYRKYRPKNLEDVVGQKEIINIFINAIEKNKFSHAYLFSGPRGTGKTSIAKILANLVNCEKPVCGKPCGKCLWCLTMESIDIIEIDAASNNGVDEIREIRDKISLMPNVGKYKVYIIDEVHMLTVQAFNALLKTLEEPPRHIIFILATTDPQKVPLTISSRCQKFNFSKFNKNDIIMRLKYIANNEKIKITDKALEEIALISDGGMRDAINILDQISVLDDLITEEEIDNLYGIISYEKLYSLFKSLIEKDKRDISIFFEKNIEENTNINMLILRLVDIFREILCKKNDIINEKKDDKQFLEIINLNYDEIEEIKIINIIEKLNDIYNSKLKDKILKIILFTLFCSLFKEKNKKNEQFEEKTTEIKEKLTKSIEIEKNALEKEKINEKTEKMKKIRVNNTFVNPKKDLLISFQNKWKQLENMTNEYDFSDIVGLLKDSFPKAVGNQNVILSTKYDYISKKINISLEKVEKVIEKLYNKKYKIISLTEEEWEKEKQNYINNIKNNKKYIYIEENDDKKEYSDSLSNLINIVGKEIIEYK